MKTEPDSLPEVAGVQHGAFRLDRTALVVSSTPSFDEWDRFGEFLSRAEGAVQWWIGDWLNYGEARYGEMYAQAIDETRFSYGTLANAKWVASRIEFSRRRENLRFAHHYEVAGLPPDEQDFWLTRAEQGDGEAPWSRSRLRVELRRQKQQKQLPSSLPTELSCHLFCSILEGVEGKIPQGSVDLILSEPPAERGVASWSTLTSIATAVLKPGGMLLVAVNQAYLPEVLALLTPHLRYLWTIAYLHDSEPEWGRKVKSCWKPILWFTKGESPMDWRSDVLLDGQHGGALEAANELLDILASPGMLVLNPYMGDGAVAVSALQRGCSYIGIDTDPENISSVARMIPGAQIHESGESWAV